MGLHLPNVHFAWKPIHTYNYKNNRIIAQNRNYLWETVQEEKPVGFYNLSACPNTPLPVVLTE